MRRAELVHRDDEFFTHDPRTRRTAVGRQIAELRAIVRANYDGLGEQPKGNPRRETHRAYDEHTLESQQTAKDPMLFAGGDVNLYGYVLNDPVNSTDVLGLKPYDLFPSAEAAAIDALNYIAPTSRYENREYAGYVEKLGDTGYYTYGDPTPGHDVYGQLPDPNAEVAAWYHTHNDQIPIGNYNPNDFSKNDRSISDTLNKPGYVLTPSGKIKKYDPRTGRSTDVPCP